MQTALAAGMTENVEAGVPRGVSRPVSATCRDCSRPFRSLREFRWRHSCSPILPRAIHGDRGGCTPGAGWLAVFVPVLLAVITVLGGLRWTVLFALVHRFSASATNGQVRSLEMAAGFDLRAGLQRGGEHRGGDRVAACARLPRYG